MRTFYILWKYFLVARIIYLEVYRHSNWNTLTLYYKLPLIKLLHSVFIGEAPTALSYLTNKPCTDHTTSEGVIT